MKEPKIYEYEYPERRPEGTGIIAFIMVMLVVLVGVFIWII